MRAMADGIWERWDGGGLLEKDLVLEIAQRLGKLLERPAGRG